MSETPIIGHARTAEQLRLQQSRDAGDYRLIYGRRETQIPIALAAQPAPNFPRLRALALFGRRPPECEAPLVIPASKNLHMTGRNRHDSILGQKPATSEQLVARGDRYRRARFDENALKTTKRFGCRENLLIGDRDRGSIETTQPLDGVVAIPFVVRQGVVQRRCNRLRLSPSPHRLAALEGAYDRSASQGLGGDGPWHALNHPKPCQLGEALHHADRQRPA